jgi:hypothetical protein
MKLFLKFVAALLLLLATVDSQACTCGMSRGSFKTMRDVALARKGNAEVIFSGMVESQEVVAEGIGPPAGIYSMTPSGRHRVVHFRIAYVYLGQNRVTPVVKTGFGTGDCGFDFETGVDYLVFANRDRKGNLFTSICSATDVLSRSGPVQRALSGKPPEPDDLLDPQAYYAKYVPLWIGKLCGRVLDENGKGLAGVGVELSRNRDPFPAAIYADPDNSKGDGTFCIRADPGSYLLSGERMDYETNSRWMGYFPSVSNYASSEVVSVEAGKTKTDVVLQLRKQPVFTVGFRLIAPDGSAVPGDGFMVILEGGHQDPLAYHADQHFENDGRCALGLVPPGHYTVEAFYAPDEDTEASKVKASWQPSRQEVEINGGREIVLTVYRIGKK